MAIPYFPMYAQDWLCDPNVSALTYEEQGIFFYLMCTMWQTSNCSLPDDDFKISRMLRINHNKWQKIKASLSEVLTYENGTFYSNRLRIEFDIAKKKSGVNSETAKKREEVKRQKLLELKETASTNVPRTDHHKDKDKDKDFIKEKEKENIKEKGKEKALVVSLPDWLPRQLWDEYLKMRVRIKKPLLPESYNYAFNTLLQLKARGFDPADVLAQSNFNSWQGLFEVRKNKQGNDFETLQQKSMNAMKRDLLGIGGENNERIRSEEIQLDNGNDGSGVYESAGNGNDSGLFRGPKR